MQPHDFGLAAPQSGNSPSIPGSTDWSHENLASRHDAAAERRKDALYRLTDRLHHAGSFDEIYAAALEAIVTALPCARASILLFDDAGVMRFVAARGLSDRYRAMVEGHSPWQATERNAEPIAICEISPTTVPTELGDAIANEGIGALAFIPLIAEHGLIGKFMAYWDRAHEVTRDEIDAGLTIARQLSVAIERRRANDELVSLKDRLAAKVEDLRRLHDFSGRVMRRSSSDEILVDLMSAAAEQQQTARATVHALDGRTGALQLVGASGLPTQIAEWPATAGQPSASPCALALRTAQTTIIDDLAGEPGLGPFAAIARQHGILAAHALPVLDEDYAVAAIVTTYHAQPHATTERERRLLDLYVEVAAHALERKHADGALAFLAELNPTVATFGSMTEIARISGERIRHRYGASRVTFSDVSPAGDALEVFHAQGPRNVDESRESYLLSAFFVDSLTDELRAGHTVVVDDVRRDPRTASRASVYADARIGSMVLAPHLTNGRWTFLLGVQRSAPCKWRAREVDELEEAATRIHLRLERARAEAALAESEARLREDDRRKDEFLAMLAHELRNPLAPIVNAVQLLDERKLGEPLQRQARAIIGRQTARLTRLVDDLLEVSRISSGRIQLQRERIALDGVIERAVETVRPLLEARRHRFQQSVPPDRLWLDADPTRIEQVVVNLLNNAIKYTDDGGLISLSLTVEGREAVLRIADNGIGIERELQPHIFDLFTQADRSLDRSSGGLGIGLALVQSLVAMHGGVVTVESEVGRGSEFTVRLPLAAPSVSGGTAATEAQPDTGVEPLRVLVVDDNVDAALSLRLLLEMAGHSVQLAHEGTEALTVAREYRPHVVFLDIGLPILDGYEVGRRLRRCKDTCDATLVALTGYGQQADRMRAKAAGFDHYLVKPVYFTSLRPILQEAGSRLAVTR